MENAEDAEKMGEYCKEKALKFNGNRLMVYVSRKYRQLKHGWGSSSVVAGISGKAFPQSHPPSVCVRHRFPTAAKRDSCGASPGSSRHPEEPPAKKPREEEVPPQQQQQQQEEVQRDEEAQLEEAAQPLEEEAQQEEETRPKEGQEEEGKPQQQEEEQSCPGEKEEETSENLPDVCDRSCSQNVRHLMSLFALCCHFLFPVAC